MHLKRWLTSIVALPLLLLLLFKGGSLLFLLLILLASWISLWEYFQITQGQWPGGLSALIPGLAFALTPVLLLAAYYRLPVSMAAVLMFDMLCCGILTVMVYSAEPDVPERVFGQVFGLLYCTLSLSCLVMIRNSDDGALWILYLLLVIFAGDVGAFYMGSYLGKHKLCPGVSPKKTVEGAAGGLVANMIVGILMKLFVFKTLSWEYSLLLPLVLGGVGQFGDLFESVLKRSRGIKDSGRILPGHGGILDRIDALLFAAPIAFVFRMGLMS